MRDDEVDFVYTTIFFFFNDTATTEIYTLSLHDALPISPQQALTLLNDPTFVEAARVFAAKLLSSKRESDDARLDLARSEEHTSELQSQSNLVCRLLLEKKNKLAAQETLAGRVSSRRPDR